MKKRIYYPGASTLTILFDRRNHIDENAKLILKTESLEKCFSGYFGEEEPFYSGLTFIGDEVLIEFQEFIDPGSIDFTDIEKKKVINEIGSNCNVHNLKNIELDEIKTNDKSDNKNYHKCNTIDHNNNNHEKSKGCCKEVNTNNHWGWGILVYASGPIYESNEIKLQVDHSLLQPLRNIEQGKVEIGDGREKEEERERNEDKIQDERDQQQQQKR